jgi:ArsR family transcriptional regulator
MNDVKSKLNLFRCCSKQKKTAVSSDQEDSDLEMAELAKALAHPARIKILRVLLERKECICGEICRHLPLAQSTISQHLKVLKEAGLIEGEVDGPRVCYCVSEEKLERLKALIAGL